MSLLSMQRVFYNSLSITMKAVYHCTDAGQGTLQFIFQTLMALSESLGIRQQKFIFLLFSELFGTPMILYTSTKNNFCLDTNLNAESAYFVKCYTRSSQCV